MSPQPHKAKLPSSKEIISVLLKDGFQPKKRSSGSHQSFIKQVPGQLTRVAVVPLNRKEMPSGTLSSILRQAGITKSYFESLL